MVIYDQIMKRLKSPNSTDYSITLAYRHPKHIVNSYGSNFLASLISELTNALILNIHVLSTNN